MAKLESSLKNMVLCLLLISMVMSAALGIVYAITKGPIEKTSKQAEIDAIKNVLPSFDNDPTKEAKTIDGLVYYVATQSGEIVGCAVKTYTNKGFAGHFEIMVGFKPDGTIFKTAILDQKETPGLGDKMKTKWKDQFNEKNPTSYKLAVKKDGGDVDAITASTITSRAFCDAVSRAYNGYMNNILNTTNK